MSFRPKWCEASRSGEIWFRTETPVRLPARFLDFARNDKCGTLIPFPTNTCPFQRRMVVCFFPTQPRSSATAPKKIDPSSAVRVEIAAVAALLRNDMWGVFLSDTGREAARRLGMTVTANSNSPYRPRTVNITCQPTPLLSTWGSFSARLAGPISPAQ